MHYDVCIGYEILWIKGGLAKDKKKRESKIERRKQKMKRNEKNTLRQYVCGHI